MPIRLLVTILVFGAAVIGCTPNEQAAVNRLSDTPQDGAMMEKPTPDATTADGTADVAAPEEQNMVDTDGSVSATIEFSGTVLAGSSAPLLDFNQADYEKALASGKTIFLYFYANWCPVCRAEVPKMYSAFNQLTTDQVVGFRVNYKDDQTDSDEEALARAHGVAYQHTKVVIQGGSRVLKSPETWDEARYLEEINKVLK